MTPAGPRFAGLREGRLAAGIALMLFLAMPSPALSYGVSERIELERIALESAISIAKSKGQIPERNLPKKTVRIGSKGEDALKLKKVILEENPFAKLSAGEEFLESDAKELAALQERFLISPDGIAGKKTYEMLKIGREERLRRILAYQESWRSVEKAASEKKISRYLVVNIPSFSLKAIEGGRVVFESKVVVGRPTRRTPTGMLRILSIKLNPEWTPPPGILKRDVYPAFARGDWDWLKEHGLEMRDAKSGETLNPEEWDLADVIAEKVRFVQPAGDGNALGFLKFETDSPNNIYLHDTNERHLFTKDMRAKSSGCVRVEKWLDLASWMSDEPAERLLSKIESGKTRYLKVKQPVPVFITYNLADMVEGKIRFARDIYRDDGTAASPREDEDEAVAEAFAEAKRRKDLAERRDMEGDDPGRNEVGARESMDLLEESGEALF